MLRQSSWGTKIELLRDCSNGSDEGLEGAQQHLADAGEGRALFPLVDRQAAGRRQVVRENLLHARGQRA